MVEYGNILIVVTYGTHNIWTPNYEEKIQKLN